MNKDFRKISINICAFVMVLSLAGCELIGYKQRDKLPLEPVKKEVPVEVFHQLENKTTITPPASERFLGGDRAVANEAQKSRKITSKGSGSYSLNFDEADLGEVAKVVLSDILGQNYVLSPKVTGKVTLQTTEPLTKDELLPALEMVLRMNNAALVKDGKIYHIEPAADALYTSDFSSRAAGYQTRVIPVKNVAVKDVADILKPLVHDKTILNVDSKRNIMVVSGSADEIARVIDMVNTFDIDILKGRSFGVFPLKHVDPETIIKELQSVFYQKGKSGDSEFFQFMPIKRLNAIMAVTHQARYLDDIESWIARLDKANTASGGGVNVYKAQHVEAKKLASTLNQIFTGAKGADTSAKVAPGETADTISNQDSSGMGSSSSNTGMGNTGMGNTGMGNTGMDNTGMSNGLSGNLSAFAANDPDNQVAGGGLSNIESAVSGSIANVGKVKIIADDANNSIIIVASAQDYEVILPIINQLDVMPLQVLIDATVVSVTLTDDLRYGISWYLSHGGSAVASTSTPPGGASLLDAAAAAAGAASTGGMSMLYSSGSVKALLNAQATSNNVNVISSPSIMVLNNQKAKINVGQQIPIQTATTSVATGSPTLATANSIQYKDTGVTLEVTPRVNANGMVIMKLSQIVSKPVPTTTGVTSSATIDKKEINSSVAVLDGETIVLGGLIDDEITNNQNGIPFLYKLPIIGSLFGGTDKLKTKQELVVLITPRVVKSQQDSRVISNEFKRKLTGIYQDNSPVNVEGASSKSRK